MMEMSFFWKLRNAWWRVKDTLAGRAPAAPPAASAADPELVHLPGFAPVRFRGAALDRSTASVDVVVLAHDDRAVLEESVGALLRHARPPYRLFLADPGVPSGVRAWLETFAHDQGASFVSGPDAFARALDAGSARARSPPRRARAPRGGRPRPAPGAASPPTRTPRASCRSPPTSPARGRRSNARRLRGSRGTRRPRRSSPRSRPVCFPRSPRAAAAPSS